MPELPEVETIKLGLQQYLKGHKILDVDIKAAKIFQGDKKNIIGAKIIDIKRFGKGLVIELDNDFDLAIHLKLTGQIVYQGRNTNNFKLSEKVGHTRVIFNLDQGANLFFNDLRMFGWIKVIKKSEINNLPFFKEMGPEPPVVPTKIGTMEGQTPLTLIKFKEILSKSSIPIKILLMNQKKIAGIGNIYANEALFLARIDPRKKANKLSPKENNKLYGSILEVLKRGLEYGGSSDSNYVNALGQDGKYQQHFLVYGRRGERCMGCRGKVEKIKLGGRGTYYCPKCQG